MGGRRKLCRRGGRWVLCRAGCTAFASAMCAPPLVVRRGQREARYRETLASGKAGIVHGHVTAAAGRRYRALGMARRAVRGIEPVVRRRASSFGPGILPRAALGLPAA